MLSSVYSNSRGDKGKNVVHTVQIFTTLINVTSPVCLHHPAYQEVAQPVHCAKPDKHTVHQVKSLLVICCKSLPDGGLGTT